MAFTIEDTMVASRDKYRMELVTSLVRHASSGLIINTGKYVLEIPDSVRKYCHDHDFPLLCVPWSVYLVDMIKDLSVRVFLQGTADGRSRIP